jgi:hypothetical protein
MRFEDFELIYSYSRKQAIEDGVLIDVIGQARETGCAGSAMILPICMPRQISGM